MHKKILIILMGFFVLGSLVFAACSSQNKIQKAMKLRTELEELRKGNFAADMLIESFRSKVAEAGLSLKDLETSETELYYLELLGHKKAAQMWLNDFLLQVATRVNKEDIKSDLEFCLANMLYHMDTNWKFEDLGTSEEELARLLGEYKTLPAQMWLDKLRMGYTDIGRFDVIRDILIKYVTKAGLTLEDLGTSDKELSRLWHKSFAMSHLETLRKGKGANTAGFLLELIFESAIDGNWILEDLGTDAWEIVELIKKYK